MSIRKTKTKPRGLAKTPMPIGSVNPFVWGQVKQRTRLNLGKNFAIEPTHWPLLAAGIEQFLQGSAPHPSGLFALADEVGQLLEAAAVRSSKFIIAKLAQPVAAATPGQASHRVDINHVEVAQARSIGVETVAMQAVMPLQLDQKLAALGFIYPQHWAVS